MRPDISVPFAVRSVERLRDEMAACPAWARAKARWDCAWLEGCPRVDWNRALELVLEARAKRSA